MHFTHTHSHMRSSRKQRSHNKLLFTSTIIQLKWFKWYLLYNIDKCFLFEYFSFTPRSVDMFWVLLGMSFVHNLYWARPIIDEIIKLNIHFALVYVGYDVCDGEIGSALDLCTREWHGRNQKCTLVVLACLTILYKIHHRPQRFWETSQ